MKFKLLLEEIISELDSKEIYQKYYSKINFADFLNIVKSDPQTVYDENEISKMGKYSKLLLSMYQKGGLKMEDLDKANEYLEYVYNHKIPLDVNKIKILSDLYNIVKDYIAKDSKTLNDVLSVLPEKEYKILYNGNKWQIFQPLTEKSSCYLGVNTEWCTTFGPKSLNKKHRDRTNMYTGYHKQGPLFIIINKENTDEKYQFHFESKQFMDKADDPINTKIFLGEKDKKEILGYFFPSFFNEVSENELLDEVKRLDLLPENLGNKLLKKALKKINNPLVKSLYSNDEKKLSKTFYNVNDIYIEEEFITFYPKTLSNDLDNLENKINYYRYETNNGFDFIYHDLRERYNEDNDIKEAIKPFLMEYYKDNSYKFYDVFSIKNVDEFLETFFEDYMNNEKYDFYDTFCSDIATLSADDYESGNKEEYTKIENDITIERKSNFNEVMVSKVKLSRLLLKKNIVKITNEDELNDILDEYISYYNHDDEFQYDYDYRITEPKYNENNYLTTKTEKYFDEILDRGSEHIECTKLRKKLNGIVEKYFKNSNTFENEHVMVKLKSLDIDCDTEMVKVEYKNKDTGKSYGVKNNNDGVKVDNLVSLLVNYKLFENYIKFNKLI